MEIWNIPYWLQLYLQITTIISIVLLLQFPSKMSRVDHVGGSIVAGGALGWLFWPLIIIATIKVRKQNG